MSTKRFRSKVFYYAADIWQGSYKCVHGKKLVSTIKCRTQKQPLCQANTFELGYEET